MRAKLFSPSGPAGGHEFFIDKEATLGRSPKNDVALVQGSISNRHARIYYDGKVEAYFLEDLGSLNGTQLDSLEVKGMPERLGHLHVITLANTVDFVFQDLDLCAARHARRKKPAVPSKTQVDQVPLGLPPNLVKPGSEVVAAEEKGPGAKTLAEELAPGLPPALAAGDRASPPAAKDPATPQAPPVEEPIYVLETTDSSGRVQRFRLQEGKNLVGRSKRCPIRIVREQISRRHASLTLERGTLTLRDEGSRNHTYCDGQRVDGEVTAKDGSALRFGDVEAKLVALHGRVRETL